MKYNWFGCDLPQGQRLVPRHGRTWKQTAWGIGKGSGLPQPGPSDYSASLLLTSWAESSPLEPEALMTRPDVQS